MTCIVVLALSTRRTVLQPRPSPGLRSARDDALIALRDSIIERDLSAKIVLLPLRDRPTGHGEEERVERMSSNPCCQLLSCFCPPFCLPLGERFISVDMTATYRRHLCWAKSDGDELLRVVNGRFTTTITFMSLMLSTEFATFFSPSAIVEGVRQALKDNRIGSVDYWAGMALTSAILLTLVALVANFNAWAIFNAVSKENAAIILRSSIGLHTAQLPARLALFSTYIFCVWVCKYFLGFLVSSHDGFPKIDLFWWIALPFGASIIFIVAGVFSINHIASWFSCMGRIIMANSAMSTTRILDRQYEEMLTPKQLNDVLVEKTRKAYKENISVMKQYRTDNTQSIDIDQQKRASGDSNSSLYSDAQAVEMEEGTIRRRH